MEVCQGQEARDRGCLIILILLSLFHQHRAFLHILLVKGIKASALRSICCSFARIFPPLHRGAFAVYIIVYQYPRLHIESYSTSEKEIPTYRLAKASFTVSLKWIVYR